MRDLLGPEERDKGRLDLGGRRDQKATRGGGQQQILRKRRTERHRHLVAQLEASGTVQRTGIDRVAAELANFYREEAAAMPLGLVARCYLGPPFVVHYLDLMGVIIDHFDAATPMPHPFETARGLALNGAYAFVEVYADRLVCVDKYGNGSEVAR